MVSQSIWIGIVITAFLVGLGSTYLIFHTGTDVNADFDMMKSAQHAQEMAAMMNANHDFTMEMMSVMIEDPALQLQMIGHMAENPEAMKQMMNLMNSDIQSQEMLEVHPEKMRTAAPLPETANGPQIDYSKGYLVEEIRDGLYWVTDGAYNTMFLTTGQGVIVVDAPPSIGENYLNAIAEGI